MRLSLWFSNDPKPELLRLSFERLPGKAYTSVRRKAVVDEPDAGSFQWTTAVRGLAALAVGTKIQSLIAGQRFVIQGEAKSLAASLDYAISKPTDWIVELFGRENSGKPTAPLLFRRENTERKRPGPVKVALNNALSESGAISIFLESKQLIAKTELERLLTKLTSAATNEDPWFSQAWFAKAISNELAVALNESDLLEGRVISKTVQRLSVNGKQPISLKTLTNQLRKNIPAPSQRYIGIKETSVAVLKEFGSTRFVCTPHQIGTLVLLKYLELEKTVPLAIDFSYPSTASIPKEKTAADSSLILSWRGALELCQQAKSVKHQVLMLLPRTTFELVTTKAASELPLKEVLLAKETLGYPRLYFEALRDEGRLISKITKSSQATLAEIIAESASPGVGAILGFPFCAIATNLFKLRYLEKGHSLSRLGDNLLMAPSSRPSAWKTALIMTLRASWHLLLEDKALRESIITELLNDCEYIATLKRIGGLYKI